MTEAQRRPDFLETRPKEIRSCLGLKKSSVEALVEVEFDVQAPKTHCSLRIGHLGER